MSLISERQPDLIVNQDGCQVNAATVQHRNRKGFSGAPFKKENGSVFCETILIECPHKPGMSAPEQASKALSGRSFEGSNHD
jgi:hypothetical protein